MFSWRKEKVIAPVRSEYRIVEIEKPREVSALDKETAQSVASLSGHPGFMYLLNKLRYQRAMLISHLARTKQDSLNEVYFLQSGVAWCTWLEDQLNQALGIVRRPSPQVPTPEELEAFQEISRALEVIGAPEDTHKV